MAGGHRKGPIDAIFSVRVGRRRGGGLAETMKTGSMRIEP